MIARRAFPKAAAWIYELEVGGVPVPACLFQEGGDCSAVYAPDVVHLNSNADDCQKSLVQWLDGGPDSLHVVCVFQFLAKDQLRCVFVSHHKCVWQIVCDGQLC